MLLKFFPPSLKIATASAPSFKTSLIYASQLFRFKIQIHISTKKLDLDASPQTFCVGCSSFLPT